ncbi:toxin-antitoxin system YwqK family antitoxin [Flavisolibacter nicotianae]|uniref:toxin-antitoxin system YwqK family antitoxin n=1 Tax=Flavisolibacter nicotianae TaxID=2364882 RepID=UPI000EAFDB82|nr:hypothetical protein [Flavisolibacter nicotianae]
MKIVLILFLLGITFPGLSYSQTILDETFNENNYVKQRQGLDPESSNELYAIWYRLVQDTSYTYKKTFLDSNYTQILTKSFYKKDLQVGPFYGYLSGILTFQGFYKQGRLDGETLTYHNGTIVQRAHYTNGIKTGLWEEFDLEGKPIRKITYNMRGLVVTEEKILSD